MTEFETNQKRVETINTELGDLKAQVDALNAKIEGLNQEKTQLATKIAEEAIESEQKRLEKEKQINEWIDKVTDDDTKISLVYNGRAGYKYHRIIIELYGQKFNSFCILDEKSKDETETKLNKIEELLNFIKELEVQDLFAKFSVEKVNVERYNYDPEKLFVTLGIKNSNKKVALYRLGEDFVKVSVSERISDSPRYNVELFNNVILTDDSTNNKSNTYAYNLTYEQLTPISTIASGLRSALNKIDEANNDFINYVN